MNVLRFYGELSFQKCSRRKHDLTVSHATWLRNGRFSLQKRSCQKIIWPCRIGPNGKQAPRFVAAGFLPEGAREETAPLCYGRFSFQECSCRQVFLSGMFAPAIYLVMSYRETRATLCYGRFSFQIFQKCPRRKVILPCYLTMSYRKMQHFVVAGFPSRRACAGNLSYHVV